MRDNTDQNFWFVPRAPAPSYAIHARYFFGSLPGFRTLQFETDQPPEEIQQFYRTELPKRGWYLLCSPTQLEQPNCPLGLSPVNELADVYTRDDDPGMVREINVIIYKPGEILPGSQNRLVEVIEYRYPRLAP